MKKNNRLFDLLDQYVALHPTKQMLHAKINGAWEGLTSEKVYEQTMQLACSLRRLGIGGNDFDIETY